MALLLDGSLTIDVQSDNKTTEVIRLIKEMYDNLTSVGREDLDKEKISWLNNFMVFTF